MINGSTIATLDHNTAFFASFASRQQKNRCAMVWSVPCEPNVRNVKPNNPHQNVNSVVSETEKSNSWNFPAARPAATMPSTPPGTATTTAASDAKAPNAIITNCTTSVHTTDVMPPIHVQPMPISVRRMIAG